MNILIVDDEPLIRSSMRIYLEQNQINPECIYEADSSKKMLEILETVPIQVAFVDIQMPGPDGLTGIKISQAQNPEVHFYVLTGYSEFNYAHRALQLHIQDYLLKPVSSGDIQAIIQKEQAFSQSKSYEKHQMYLKILEQNMQEHFSDPKPVRDAVVLCVGCLKQTEFRDCIDWFRKILLTSFPIEFIQCSFLCWSYFIFNGKIDEAQLVSVLSEVKKTSFPQVLYLSSDKQPDLTLQEVQSASYEMLFFPHGSIRTELTQNAARQAAGRYLARLLYWKSEKNFDQFNLTAKQFISFLSQSSTQIHDKENQYFAEFVLHTFYAEEESVQNSSELAQIFHRFAAEQLMKPDGTTAGSMDSIQSYIDSHFQEKITVQQLARLFGYSANHISAAFSKQFGVTVIQYLNRIRLSNACRLLTATNLSMQEIAEFVGYSDGNYFARTFTQEYKCSPSVYRKTHTGNGQ